MNENAEPQSTPQHPHGPASGSPNPQSSPNLQNPQDRQDPAPSYGYPPAGAAPAYGQPPAASGYGQVQAGPSYPHAQAASPYAHPQAAPAYGQPGSYGQVAYPQLPGYGAYGSDAGGDYRGYYQPGGYPYATSPAPVPRQRRRWVYGVAAAAIAAALVGGGVAIGQATGGSHVAGSGSVVEQSPGTGSGNLPGGTVPGGTVPGGTVPGGTVPGGTVPGGTVPGGTVPGGGGGAATTTGTPANSTQKVGIVTVIAVLGYQNAESEGTGMILSANGEILTNNHVIDGATKVTVTDESTNRTYTATVVGTSPTNDVAVLQAQNASGLKTAKLASDASNVSVGDAVIGVGNANGTDSLTASPGKVTALSQSITASDESGGNSEKLSGLIQTSAQIIPGDSGGPLYAADGKIVGMDTAAATHGDTTTAAYAIPIEKATGIADQIEAGVQTTSIHIGYPGFLGVGLSANATQPVVSKVLQGGPALGAGITAGSTITAINGKSVTTADALHNALAGLKPGTKISVSWTDANGAAHTKTLTLATGPAD